MDMWFWMWPGYLESALWHVLSRGHVWNQLQTIFLVMVAHFSCSSGDGFKARLTHKQGCTPYASCWRRQLPSPVPCAYPGSEAGLVAGGAGGVLGGEADVWGALARAVARPHHPRPPASHAAWLPGCPAVWLSAWPASLCLAYLPSQPACCSARRSSHKHKRAADDRVRTSPLPIRDTAERRPPPQSAPRSTLPATTAALSDHVSTSAQSQLHKTPHRSQDAHRRPRT